MTTMDAFAEPDPEMEAVADELLRSDPNGARWAAVVRHTYDMIYNGAETGRYRWDQLMKTEKTHFGTLFEINAQREFEFDGGDQTDYRIAGHQVDAKWSQKEGSWMLPPEVFGRLALVATGNDERAIWSLGLVRVRQEYCSEGANRDQKTTLNSLGRSSVRWLWKDSPMPANILLQLPRPSVDDLFTRKYGTQRTNQLFRLAEGQLVHRSAVRTVAMQLDDQKRVRTNGGARSALAPEGYIILSGTRDEQKQIAADLGVSVPSRTEFISVRIVPAGPGSGVEIKGEQWRRATPGEVSTKRAPLFGKTEE